MENGTLEDVFAYWNWGYSIAMLVYQRVSTFLLRGIYDMFLQVQGLGKIILKVGRLVNWKTQLRYNTFKFYLYSIPLDPKCPWKNEGFKPPNIWVSYP